MEIEYLEEEDQYYSLVTLKSLNQFEKIDDPKDSISVDFYDIGEQPNEEQITAFQFLLNNEEKVFSSLIKGAVTSYNSVYLERFKDLIEFLPKIENEDDFKKAVTIENIIISDNHEDDASFVMFKGECNWDEEHGFCIVMLKDKFITMKSWHYYH